VCAINPENRAEAQVWEAHLREPSRVFKWMFNVFNLHPLFIQFICTHHDAAASPRGVTSTSLCIEHIIIIADEHGTTGQQGLCSELAICYS
jgi:hypothetical protein